MKAVNILPVIYRLIWVLQGRYEELINCLGKDTHYVYNIARNFFHNISRNLVPVESTFLMFTILCWWWASQVTKNKTKLHRSFALWGKVDKTKEQEIQMMVFTREIELEKDVTV